MADFSNRSVPLELITATEETLDDQFPTIGSLLGTRAFRESTAALPIALGLDERGTPLLLDLATAPHLLIGGTTGSGKSNAVHGVITSLLHARMPAELTLFLVDTKRLELPAYRAVPHLGYTIITNASDAVLLLQWVAMEGVDRAALLEVNGSRGISEFNGAVGSVVLIDFPRQDLAPEDSPGPYVGGRLPRIVVVVDDLADLTADNATHDALTVIAQLGRATGIHLVCVTQRPSVAVVAGDAKALFPARMAFRLPAAVDSRVILDRNGAETLHGNGAFLVVSNEIPRGVRAQSPLVARLTADAISDWYEGAQPRHRTTPDLLEIAQRARAAADAEPTSLDVESLDPLFREAGELCIQNKSGSTSLLQRRLGIGYGRAARLIDQLADVGILDARSGPAGREVRIDLEALHQMLDVRANPPIARQGTQWWPGMRFETPVTPLVSARSDVVPRSGGGCGCLGCGTAAIVIALITLSVGTVSAFTK